MRLQTLSLNCLACHILSKHRLVPLIDPLTTINNTQNIIQVHSRNNLERNEAMLISNPTCENPLRKIA